MGKKPPKHTPREALNQLMDLCGRVEKSPWEVEKKLEEWGLEAQTESILAELMKDNFLNSRRFATSFTHDKLKFNKWGKIKIRYALKSHRIEPSVIETVLEEIDRESYTMMIQDEMEKKLKTLRESIPFRIKSKLYAFGNQRGYEADIMNRYFHLKGI
jgi:regulatory protein